MTSSSTLWRGTGNTDRWSFRWAISRSITSTPSPMAAEADDIYDVLAPARLTRLAAAMAWHERKNDTWKPDYGLDSSYRNPWAMKLSTGQWARYESYEEAARSWLMRLTSPSGPYAATNTIRDLIHVYAPGFDGNDEASYVSAVITEIDRLWPSEGGEMATNPFPTPVIYDIARDADAARYSLTPAERDRLLTKCIPNRNGARPTVVVLHSQDGVTAGSLDWWANNVQASATVLINKDGSIVRCISEANGPWTNGDPMQSTSTGLRVLNTFGSNPNLYSLTVEAEGRPNDTMPEKQLLAICWQTWDWMDRYGIKLENVIRHSDLNNSTAPQVGRAYCPGQYYGRVIAELGGVPEENWPRRPVWLPANLVKTLFPEAAPNGLRTNAWFDHCAYAGTAPRRVAFHFKDTPQETIEFSDGLLIFKDGSTSADNV